MVDGSKLFSVRSRDIGLRYRTLLVMESNVSLVVVIRNKLEMVGDGWCLESGVMQALCVWKPPVTRKRRENK